MENIFHSGLDTMSHYTYTCLFCHKLKLGKLYYNFSNQEMVEGFLHNNFNALLNNKQMW
jgi:hypothetical protein